MLAALYLTLYFTARRLITYLNLLDNETATIPQRRYADWLRFKSDQDTTKP